MQAPPIITLTLFAELDYLLLELLRDGHFGEAPADGTYPGLVAFLNRLNTDWYWPAYLALQTGGGLGMVAAGTGYEYSKTHLETDVLIGYVPKYYAGSTLSMASLKFLYSPFHLPVGEKFQVVPLTLGAYFSYTHGTIDDELKGQYSSDYCWFSTDTRYGPLLGSRVTFLAPPVRLLASHAKSRCITSWAATTCIWPATSTTATVAWALASS